MRRTKTISFSLLPRTSKLSTLGAKIKNLQREKLAEARAVRKRRQIITQSDQKSKRREPNQTMKSWRMLSRIS